MTVYSIQCKPRTLLHLSTQIPSLVGWIVPRQHTHGLSPTVSFTFGEVVRSPMFDDKGDG